MAKVATGRTHETVEKHSKLFRDLMLGFVRVHVLYHASKGPIYGSGISAELETHGYRLSWGTLFPLLHSLESEGFLVRDERVVNGKVRKYYELTDLGRAALERARYKALELIDEVMEVDLLKAVDGDGRRGVKPV
jgi:PadR family transcriptional regulator, regulatory protein PadR